MRRVWGSVRSRESGKLLRPSREQNPKPEGRNPKEVRRPKPESEERRTRGLFGFRISTFFRPSDFGLRVSIASHFSRLEVRSDSHIMSGLFGDRKSGV